MQEKLPVEDSFTQQIALIEMADELRCHKMTLFKIAKRLGIQPIKRRDPDRGNQLVAIVTSNEADQIRVEYLANKKISGRISSDPDALTGEVGVFYLIQLEPEHDPGRIKVGFTTYLDERLRKHRCSAPFGKCLKSWPCRPTWERAAIDCLTNGLEQLHTEVFRAKSVIDIVSLGDRFFSLMPGLKTTSDGYFEDEPNA